ncbi:Gcv operon activator [Ruegeria denitrificans]|uniref:Gcv operon activator n=1 Tax=Ruegeria denitrificans TaxID=1715692 RepID=A0A0P1IHY0_9RHOB|nr:LysR family transcriptional regulator [Ruegeria denitrificans]CUJ97081.1 Gcv operon activator [Ruegeria denitrificans]
MRFFQGVCRLRSFSKAATELGLTQPTVSYRVGKLEALLSGQLFTRTRRGINITDAGHRFYRKIQPGLSDLAVRPDSHANAQPGPGLKVIPMFSDRQIAVCSPSLFSVEQNELEQTCNFSQI